MKIETNILEDFLKKVRLNEIENCLLEFRDTGLFVSAISPANTHKAESLLYKDSFEEYEPIGNVGIDDLSRFIKVIKRIGPKLEFEIEGNLLTAKGNKKELRFELVDEKFIEKSKDIPNFDFTTFFKITAEQLQDFLQDAETNKDCAIIIETVDNGVKLHNSGKYKFTHNIDSEGTKAGERCKYGQPFFNSFKELKTGELDIQMKTDYPMLAKYKTDKYEMLIFVAPRVEEK